MREAASAALPHRRCRRGWGAASVLASSGMRVLLAHNGKTVDVEAHPSLRYIASLHPTHALCHRCQQYGAGALLSKGRGSRLFGGIAHSTGLSVACGSHDCDVQLLSRRCVSVGSRQRAFVVHDAAGLFAHVTCQCQPCQSALLARLGCYNVHRIRPDVGAVGCCGVQTLNFSLQRCQIVRHSSTRTSCPSRACSPSDHDTGHCVFAMHQAVH